MAKEMAILAVSVITLFVAGFVAYSINGLDTSPNPTPPQMATAEVKDYTSELESIQSTLNQVRSKLQTLESDTIQELQKIKTELAEVKAITIELEQDTTETKQAVPFRITLDKTSYGKGDVIMITAQGSLPQKLMTLQLLSSFNEIITTKTAFSDSMGVLSYAFKLPEFISAGTYTVKATSEGNVAMNVITISDSSSAEPEEPSVAYLSVSLNKEKFTPGDIIKVTGSGQPNTTLAAKLVSPDEQISTANSRIGNDGTYTMIFTLDSQAKTGNWKLEVSQGDNKETITFPVQS